MRQSFKLEKQDWQLLLVLLAALMLALIAHIATLKTLEEFEDANNKIVKVYDGTANLQNLDRHLIEIVHSQDNYIKTGDEKFVKNADEAVQNIQKDLFGIEQFFQNELTLSQIDSLQDLIAQKINFHKTVIATYRAGGQAAVDAFPNFERGMILRDHILAITDKLRQYHRKHLLASVQRKRTLGQQLKWVSLTGVLFIFFIAAFSLYYLLRTARRRLLLMNSLIEAKEHAEQAAYLKEQFIANMSHEIRTPLNAIIGFSNLMQRTELTAKQTEFTHSIRTSSENLLSIINDILDFSKIEAGALRLEQIPFHLPGLIHSIESMFLYKAKEKKLEFNTVLSENVPQYLSGDPTRLSQILVNLLGNAFKFTSEGLIEMRISSKQIEDEQLRISIEVEDSGIGIPEEKMNNIFERFSQASSETTRKYGGAGLGLTITRQLVEAQHGSIDVKSKVGVGTCFTVEIPYRIARPEKQQELPHKKNTEANVKDARILIVEDNSMNYRMAELILDDWGLQHEHAPNGAIALEMLKKASYDLILMDIQMPEMDGYTATRHIRDELKLDTPIIATTAHAFAGEREKCISKGMDEYISKPLRENELLRLINKFIPSNKAHYPDSIVTAPELPGFDKSYIEDISKGKQEVIQEMIELFIKQSEQELNDIKTALKLEHWEDAAAAAHSMKSTTAYMGLQMLFEPLLNKLEMKAKSDSPASSELSEHYQELETLRSQAIDFLKKEYLD